MILIVLQGAGSLKTFDMLLAFLDHPEYEVSVNRIHILSYCNVV